MSKQAIWLSVIGIEEDGFAELSSTARQLIDQAEVIYGGARHLAMLGDHPAKRQPWVSPFASNIAAIEAQRGKNIVVLSSGDPLWFGIGATLLRTFKPSEMRIMPARSSFSLAASAVGWAIADCQLLSLHGPELSTLARHLAPRGWLLMLTKNGEMPAQIAQFMVARGFGESTITVMEHLGGGKQRIRSCRAGDYDLSGVSELNIVAIDCVAGEDASWYSTVPGLPDEAFCHDGQLTKSVVRAATLAALKPFAGGLLWDVGAGCGSVAIEWMRAAASAKSIAIETNEARCEFIRQNVEALGVNGLKIINAAAPEALENLPAPNAIFIGGGLTKTEMFETCWRALVGGGVLVVNAVTLESEARLFALHAEYGGTLRRISVEQVAKMGTFRGWKQARPVCQWVVSKPGVAS